MNNKALLVICFLELFIIGYLINDRKNYEPSVSKSEELQKDSIIRDSIYIVNDSIRTEIKYIKEQHKKDSVSIMSANDSVLFDIFTRYIEDYNNK
jgi:hypothetical protein